MHLSPQEPTVDKAIWGWGSGSGETEGEGGRDSKQAMQVCVCLNHDLMVDSHWGSGMSGWEGGQQASRDGGREESKRSKGTEERREGRKRAMRGMGGEAKAHWATWAL